MAPLPATARASRLFGLGICLAVVLFGCLPTPRSAPARRASQRRQPVLMPMITHGPLSGEISPTGAVLWARGNQPGELHFTVAAVEPFATSMMTAPMMTAPMMTTPVVTATVAIDMAADLTGKAPITGLLPAHTYLYTAALVANGITSEPVVGQFTTTPTPETATALNFVFGACLGGQNYCRNKETGWVIFDTMAAAQPDFFMLTGDSIYADTACDGEQNVPGAEGPFADLEGYRTRYRYHLEDVSYADFLAKTPVFVTWDDQEVLNDFSGPQLKSLNPDRLAEGTQAYFEYWPLTGSAAEPNRIYRQFNYGAHADFFILDTRSYRDPNVNWDSNPRTAAPKTMLGPEQFAWLQAGLTTSSATWKFIVTSVPLAYPSDFPPSTVGGWASDTARIGYETELTALIFYITTHDIQNVIFLAGDTHWPYAISYDPDRDGTPNFYELASSPLSALPLAPPATLDPTFNPTLLYAEGELLGDLFNFGQVSIDEAGALRYRVMDWQGQERYALTLEPKQ
ncbi:MAG: alkaline phosphatase D family protein [Caldilineaceae bacterium]|nr:alkaline phosphatase D family protein [Caldilineaceae bacterium]